ncbi:MAG: nitroreductase [Gammaproteobacteria bacterium]|nr:nitroreductase [Gammaproteobacteria bacterium]
MKKGSEIRRAHYPVDAIFLDRWSPRAMSGEEISEHELLTLFEAARWAPSSFNAQPWRMLYVRRTSGDWPVFLDLLADPNKVWACHAAALVLFVSKKLNDKTGQSSITHSFDAGAAWGFFALQAFLKGYVVHGMQGFDYARAHLELEIPQDFQVEAMVAVGVPGAKETLPPPLQERETPNDRRPLTETVCEGRWALRG